MTGPFESAVDHAVRESLDSPAALSWVTKTATRWTGLFDVVGPTGESQSYRVTMDDIAGTNFWQVRFYRETVTGSLDGRVASVNSRQVLATVVAAVRALVRAKAPKSITFTAEVGEGRSGVYGRLAKAAAREFGLKAELLSTPNGHFYRISR